MTERELMYAWFDEDDVPRAYAQGPESAEQEVREMADAMFDQYCDSKPYRVDRDGWSLHRRLVGEGDWEVV